MIVAAQDFDIDSRTGFMPPQPPLARLPERWDVWEKILEAAHRKRLKLATAEDLTAEDEAASEDWRRRVRELPVLSTAELTTSETFLRRIHHVLAWIMLFYVNTLPLTSPILIPRPISIPFLEVSAFMELPPILTYSDDVLYNWKYKDVPKRQTPFPTPSNIAIQTTFSSTHSEEHFYLVSAYIELHGATALSLMSRVMDEVFACDSLALQRIASRLLHLAQNIDELTEILMTMREGCDPEVFYYQVRPWFKGQDSMDDGRKWLFEGVGDEGYEHLRHPTEYELHGPSAGQSTLVHTLDIFLGVGSSKAESDGDTGKPQPNFLARMQNYMPRNHRALLRYLSSHPRPLRALVETETSGDPCRNPELLEAYNVAVKALRKFRDVHLRVVAMYIVGPSRRVEAGKRSVAGSGSVRGVTAPSVEDAEEGSSEKGTGGTVAMKFLKNVRDRTAGTVLDKS